MSLILLSSLEYPSQAKEMEDIPDSSYVNTLVPIDDVNGLNSSLKSEFENKKINLENDINYRRDFQARVDRAEAIISRYGGYMSGYGNIIVSQADACGGDWRLLLAIAGNESGFGRIPYKLYNPYGYLNGVQYASWQEALSILSCEVSYKHLAPCNNDVSCVIVRYGGPDTDKEKWVRNITYFINQI